LNKDLLKMLKWTPRDPEVQRIILSQNQYADNDQKLLFMQICRKPDAFKTEHKKDLGWTNARFDKEVKRAEAQGFLTSAEFYLGTPGRQPELLEFTDKGRDLAEQFGLKIPKHARGGAAHNLYVKRVSTYFIEQGYEMRPEYALSAPPIFIDLYGRKENSRVAVEIELNISERAVDRLKVLVETNVFDQVWLLSDRKEIISKAKHLARIDYPGIVGERLFILTIQEFLRERR
jgi:hypothetical protein